MKTLKADLKPNGTGLESLIVEMDGFVSAVRLIIPRLLVAAQLETNKFAGETNDEVSAKIAGLGVDQGKDEGCEPADGVKVDCDAEAESGESKDEDDVGPEDSDGAGEKPGKMRILEWKVEGMAECLVEEYPAKLPHDFY